MIGICLAEAVACRGEPDSLEQRVQEPQDAALRQARESDAANRGARDAARNAAAPGCLPPNG